MYTVTLSGTRAELTKNIHSLIMSGEIRGVDAVKRYAIEQIPTLPGSRYKVVLSVQSINNVSMSTVAGHITVVVAEIMTPQQTR